MAESLLPPNTLSTMPAYQDPVLGRTGAIVARVRIVKQDPASIRRCIRFHDTENGANGGEFAGRREMRSGATRIAYPPNRAEVLLSDCGAKSRPLSNAGRLPIEHRSAV